MEMSAILTRPQCVNTLQSEALVAAAALLSTGQFTQCFLNFERSIIYKDILNSSKHCLFDLKQIGYQHGDGFDPVFVMPF